MRRSLLLQKVQVGYEGCTRRREKHLDVHGSFFGAGPGSRDGGAFEVIVFARTHAIQVAIQVDGALNPCNYSTVRIPSSLEVRSEGDVKRRIQRRAR